MIERIDKTKVIIGLVARYTVPENGTVTVLGSIRERNVVPMHPFLSWEFLVTSPKTFEKETSNKYD